MTAVTLSNQRTMFVNSITLSEQKVIEREVEADELKSNPNGDKSIEISQNKEKN